MLLNVLLTSLAAFSITFLAIPAIMRVALEKKLFDLPDDRKLHKHSIASLGGVGIFIGLFVSFLLSVSLTGNPEFQYFFAAAIVIFFLGLKDDILVLSASKKFIGQLAATAIIIHLGHIRIDSMHSVFGIYQLPEPVSILLSYTTIIVIINAFNLIDGVDGLAGSIGVLTTSVFGVYFLNAGLLPYALFSFAMAGSLAAFLYFNFNPAKIFMGDSGSLLLGMINAILALKFIAVADSKMIALPIESPVAIGCSVLILPLLDTLRVFSIRIARGRSPFSADRNHIHHLLLDRGYNHREVTFICVLLNAAFIIAAYLGRSLGSTWLLLGMTVISFSLVGLLIRFVKPVRRMVVAISHKTDADKAGTHTHTPPKVVAFEAAAAEQ